MTVPENNIEVLIFPNMIGDSSEDLDLYLNQVNTVIKKYSADYMWHMDQLMFSSYNINLHSDTIDCEKDSLPPFIFTSLNFGENVDDEWFTVYLMLQVSLEVPGVIIRLWDADGEFLLIEAADYLPKWCNPEICSGMVFLYNGHIHIVDRNYLTVDPACKNDSSNISKILTFIRNNENRTKADPHVQEEIKSKIQDYPSKIQDLIHHSHAYLPISLAKLIQKQPHFIANATRAFCSRDALEMKTVNNFPRFCSEQKILQRIKFTKCLYAMLMSSQFVHPSVPPTSHPDQKAHSIGVRIMCGFEILLSQVQDIESRCKKQWNQYLLSLQKKGYFKDLLEGSNDYKELESMARDFFMKNQSTISPERTIGNEILDFLEDPSLELSQEPLLPADDDNWMSISSQDLDQILLEKFGLKDASCSSSSDVVSSAINRFLHHTSDIEGAEFPHGDKESANEDGTEKASQSKTAKSTSPKSVEFQDEAMDTADEICEDQVDFNLDEFSAVITKMLDSMEQRAGADIASDEDSDDYISGSDSDDYMKAMEQELSGTTLAQSFVKKEEDDSVDIDMNALHNVIQSYEAQIGTAGPASNVLMPMGINIRALLEKEKSASDRAKK